MIIAVSQPMFVPWSGIFEQIMLSDIFVHYDDVQRPQGRSFTTRVQIKSNSTVSWLSAPVDKRRSGLNINESYYLDSDWRERHVNKIEYCYSKSKFKKDMFNLVYDIYGFSENNISEFNIHAIEYLSKWLDLDIQFMKSSDLNIKGKSSGRLLNICRELDATEYNTGHGALNYLDENMFKEYDISITLMDYSCTPYDQQHGEFTPYVTILDMIANCGRSSVNNLRANKKIFRT